MKNRDAYIVWLSCSVIVGLSCICSTMAGENLLVNPGFEDGVWNSWGSFGEGWSRSEEYVAGGKEAVVNEVNPREGNEWRGIFQDVEVTPGKMYKMSAEIRARSLDNAKAYLEIQFVDENDNVVEQYQSDVVSKDQVFKLTELGPIIAPAGAVRASVRGIVQKEKSDRPTNDHVFFDEFTFETVDI